ncbi:MAG: hypothetical protein IT379_33460 [Deltaproteobacteria bacterium]|nr:hypothetical protein [Deltaproteobacteria bacterium]
MRTVVRLIGLAVLATSAASARAQDTLAQPADSARERARGDDAPSDEPTFESVTRAVRTRRRLREEDLVGEYGQPLWSTHRRFPTTRVYVVPAGSAQFEWWLELKQSLRDAQAARYRSQYELELGLGHHLQLDLYLTTQQLGHNPSGTLFDIHEEKVELGWALADWDVIPTNPTLYLELVRSHDGPPRVEAKLLFGGEITSRLHWGANIVFEHELAGRALANEYALVFAGSYTIADRAFSLGLELKLEMVDRSGDRFAFASTRFSPDPASSGSPCLRCSWISWRSSEPRRKRARWVRARPRRSPSRPWWSAGCSDQRSAARIFLPSSVSSHSTPRARSSSA